MDGLRSEIEILGGGRVVRYVVAESHLTLCRQRHLRWEFRSILCGLQIQLVSDVTVFQQRRLVSVFGTG
jgi:hypothetical protein